MVIRSEVRGRIDTDQPQIRQINREKVRVR
jgi:hypothetical protein